ncbi:MAG: Eco57I restriction-modification methylase domain-containing protein [Akkermansia muciniphila]
MTPFRFCKHFNLLFSPDLLQRIFERQPKYAVSVLPGLSVRDEAQRAYRIARMAWLRYQAAPSDEEQQKFISATLKEVLGYSHLNDCPAEGISPHMPNNERGLFGQVYTTELAPGEHLFPVSLLAEDDSSKPVLPVIIAPAKKSLDDKLNFPTGHHLSAAQMMQAFLNASDFFTWGLVTNGASWRLLRDNPSLSRPCYLEIDLERILEEEDSSAFDGVFWHMLHVSRATRQLSDDGKTCPWEQWRQDLEEHGARAREGLREGVEDAICRLGTGFLQGEGPGNEQLCAALRSGKLTPQDFYQELMRTVYRLIFLAVLEGRNILHEHDKSLRQQADLYRQGYSLSRLTRRALQGEQEVRHDDLWQAQLIVFRALAKDGGEPALALPALGGLFDAHQCRNLDACRLPNRAFLAALRSLCWTQTEGRRTQVDYAHIGAEELGSVYESLLELTPRISTERRLFYFPGGPADPEKSDKKQKGNARKLTGSYYTPSCLVEQVLRTTLDPLLDECCKNPVYAQSRLLALRVIDPACGSGHFLLRAAHRIAERLAGARSLGQMGGATPDVFQRAIHDVIRRCIYGVDINPLSIELVRMNLWLEGYQPGKPLSFLDAHLRCGNSLLGLFSAEALHHPIPEDAFKCRPGDDEKLCKELNKINRRQAKERELSPILPFSEQPQEDDTNLPENSPSQVREAARNWQARQQELADSPAAVAADLWVGAFLVPKTSADAVPTTGLLDSFLSGLTPADHPAILAARQACRQANVFHWHLAFPEVFAKGGFHCVLGNPPWDKVQMKEEEWFAKRNDMIAKASGATRKKYIDLLSKGRLRQHLMPGEYTDIESTEIALYREYESELHRSLSSSVFYHTDGTNGGRFALTGKGIVNLYALFAETNFKLKADDGRAGFILPTGIATDDATSAFFGHLVKHQAISSLYDFENRAKLFPEVDSRQRFSCLTLASSDAISVACYMTHPKQLEDKRRIAELRVEDFVAINPNTGTAPLFRCRADAELAVKLYRRAPILIHEKTGENPWGITFKQGLFNMTSASHLFLTKKPEGEDVLPLYEGKLIHHYDHRFNTFTGTGDSVRNLSEDEHKNPDCEITPRYWVRRADVLDKLPKELKTIPGWFLGFRNITNATNERSLIISFLPFSAVGNSMPLIFVNKSVELLTCFVANASALLLDYVLRRKLGGINLNFFYFEQLPFLPPSAYTAEDIAYISSRVLELSYTSHSMRPLAEALGYDGEPFAWDESRRAQLKAELDAYYARLYGLTREELAYILDPTVKYPADCPTLTFPTLQSNELKQYGEYRTQRLVLAAFDALNRETPVHEP